MAQTERKVIALVNRKGGVAKTTSSGYIAAVLHEAGRKVTGIDTDPEQNWVKWQATAKLPYPVVSATAKTLGKAVKDAPGDVVIDTPPNDGEIIMTAGLLADEIIIPVGATGHDMSRLQNTLELVERVEQARGRPLASVVMTRYNERTVLSREALAEMGERNIPVAQSKIRELERYKPFTAPEYQEEYLALLEELEIV